MCIEAASGSSMPRAFLKLTMVSTSSPLSSSLPGGITEVTNRQYKSQSSALNASSCLLTPYLENWKFERKFNQKHCKFINPSSNYFFLLDSHFLAMPCRVCNSLKQVLSGIDFQWLKYLSNNQMSCVSFRNLIFQQFLFFCLFTWALNLIIFMSKTLNISIYFPLLDRKLWCAPDTFNDAYSSELD